MSRILTQARRNLTAYRRPAFSLHRVRLTSLAVCFGSQSLAVVTIHLQRSGEARQICGHKAAVEPFLTGPAIRTKESPSRNRVSFRSTRANGGNLMLCPMSAGHRQVIAIPVPRPSGEPTDFGYFLK